MRTTAAILVVTLAACGDNGGDQQSDAATTADADADTTDARTCAPDEQPANLQDALFERLPFHLALDGTGARCDQLIEALLDPERTPPLLIPLVSEPGVVSECLEPVGSDRDIVVLRPTQLAGETLYAASEVAAEIQRFDDSIWFMVGTFAATTGPVPGPACLGPSAMHDVVIDQRLQYQGSLGIGSIPIRGDDELVVLPGDGLFVAGVSLHRVRVIDIRLLPSHVTPEIAVSDLNCCTGGSLLHCVGARAYVDAFTGDILGQESGCPLPP